MRPPTAAELELYERARAAAAAAHAPYSRFRVGAAIRPSGGGDAVVGVNVENASYGLTSCAERNALFAAVALGARPIEAIAVHADAETAPPCGACRQVMHELAPGSVVVYRSGGKVVAAGLAELLPEPFEL